MEELGLLSDGDEDQEHKGQGEPCHERLQESRRPDGTKRTVDELAQPSPAQPKMFSCPSALCIQLLLHSGTKH